MRKIEYHKPETAEEAVALKAHFGDEARYWAGGTDLYLLMERRNLRIGHCIDLSGVSELEHISEPDGSSVRIGAMTPLSEIEAYDWKEPAFAALAETAKLMCTPQTRTLATVGGNMCHAAPSADLSPPLIAVQATAQIASANGRRTVPLEDFFLGVNKTALGDGELLVSLSLPKLERQACAYRRVARTVVDIALVSSSVSISLGSDDRVDSARVVLGAVAPTPLRAPAAESALIGLSLDELLNGKNEVISEAAAAASRPITDIRGSEWYRRQMCGVLTARALENCAKSLEGGY